MSEFSIRLNQMFQSLEKRLNTLKTLKKAYENKLNWNCRVCKHKILSEQYKTFEEFNKAINQHLEEEIKNMFKKDVKL